MAGGWLAGWWRAGRRARGPPPLPPPPPPPPGRAGWPAGTCRRGPERRPSPRTPAPPRRRTIARKAAAKVLESNKPAPGEEVRPSGGSVPAAAAAAGTGAAAAAARHGSGSSGSRGGRGGGQGGVARGGCRARRLLLAAGCWRLPDGAARPDPSFAPLPAAAPPSISRPPTHFITLPVPHRQAQGQGPGAGEEVRGAGARGRAGGTPLAAACCASLRPPVGRQRRGSGVAGLQQCAWPAPALREPAAYSGRSCRLEGAVAPGSSGPRQQRSAPAGSHSM